MLETTAVRPRLVRGLALGLGVAALVGCGELRGRHHAREGNRLYRDGDYAAAILEYETAERLRPGLPAVAMNQGLACRQQMIPGAQSPGNQRAVDCALAAFSRLKRLKPDDPRADALYVQTLFDADRFDALARLYEGRLARRADDMAAIHGLIQVHTRAGRWKDALRWTERRAELARSDAEAQYAAGVFVWNLLFQKGGGADKASYDPRPEATNSGPAPLFNVGDIVGAERIRLADLGISYLEKALALRPNYREAMTYLNLLHRQRSFASFARPEEWQAAVDTAETWRRRATAPDPSRPAPP